MRPPEKQKKSTPPPKGNHIARLYQLFHFGHIPTEYQGEKRMTDTVKFSFELCNETKVFKESDEPKPLSISTRDLTYSMGKKANLLKLVEGMIGEGLLEHEANAFDIEKLVGQACLLNVVHTVKGDDTYANIQGASPLPKGMMAPAMFNEKRIIDIDTCTQEEIEALPEWLQDKFKMSEEYDKRFRGGSAAKDDITAEDGPFGIPF